MLYDLYQQASTPWEWHEPIFTLARELGLVPFSSPFDPTAIDLLEKLDAPAYKVASSELVDLPLIRLMAETGKPMVISTGMATLGEIDAAVRVARETGNENIIVLGCTASYPAPPEESNLRQLPVLANAFGVQVGLSDHTLGIGAAVAAVALGATLIEKHVTISREGGGVDSAFSLEPARADGTAPRDRGGVGGDGVGRSSARPSTSVRACVSAGRCSSSKTSRRATWSAPRTCARSARPAAWPRRCCRRSSAAPSPATWNAAPR